MTNDENERAFETEPEIPADVAFPEEEDLRYAPAGDGDPEDADPVEVFASSGTDKEQMEPLEAPPTDETVEIAALPAVDDLDIGGALAAVASLSDMLAEQEAAEQARIEQAEAEAKAVEERQVRLEHPERFFPMPPLTTLHRGHLASVIPALVLILMGAWLTFTLTTAPPDAALIAAVAVAGLAAILLVRWLSSGRWARGALFFALLLIFSGSTVVYLLQPAGPELARGWPGLLLAAGATFLLTGLLSQPADRRLFFPALVFGIAGLAALAITLGLLDGALVAGAASLWPVVALLVVALWLLPLVFRQRQ